MNTYVFVPIARLRKK